MSRAELLSRLDTIGELAPHAPLSFLVVHVHAEPRELQDAMRTAGRKAGELVRSTDVVGRLTSSCLGVVLQGTGSTAASAVAARMSYHLGQRLGPDAGALVQAATGTGLNADTLPLAALDFTEGPARA